MRRITLSSMLCAISLVTTNLDADAILVPPGGDIQAAIDVLSDGDTVELQAGLYQPIRTIDLRGKALTLIGAVDKLGEPASTIDGQGTIRVFSLGNDEGPDTVIENIRISNGTGLNGPDASQSGGGMYTSASPTIRNCHFEDNIAWSGGAIAIIGEGLPEIEDCRFDFNQAQHGAAIAVLPADKPVSSATLDIDSCEFTSNNVVQENSGIIAIITDNRGLVIRNSVFSNNTGASTIRHDTDINPLMQLLGTQFEDVTDTVLLSDATIHALACEFTGNAEQTGISASDFLCVGSDFRFFGQHAVNAGECSIYESEFRNNNGRTTIVSSGDTPARIQESVFTDNAVSDSLNGVMLLEAGGRVTSSMFVANQGVTGSAIYSRSGSLVLGNCLFNENVGIMGTVACAGDLEIFDCDFSNNVAPGTAAVYAGGLLPNALGQTISISDSIFFNNDVSDTSLGCITILGSEGLNYSILNTQVLEGNGTGIALQAGFATPDGGTGLIEDCEIRNNGGIGLLNSVLSSFEDNGVRSTVICGNEVMQVVGSWVELGGNTYGPDCSVLPGDFDENQKIDGADLAVLLGAWGACLEGSACFADLDGDRVVDVADLTILFNNWGPYGG